MSVFFSFVIIRDSYLPGSVERDGNVSQQHCGEFGGKAYSRARCISMSIRSHSEDYEDYSGGSAEGMICGA